MSRGHSSHATASGSGSGGQTEVELSDPFQVGLRFGQDRLKDVLIATFKCCSTDAERLEVIGKAQGIALKFIKAEMTNHIRCQQIGVVMDELQAEDRLTDENIIEVVSMIEETALKKAAVLERSLTPEKLKEHDYYKSLMVLVEKLETERHIQPAPNPNVSVVTEVEGPSDQPAEEIIPVTDPITKQSLNDPVRNKHCSHIYGKAAILELVRKNPHIRCPTIGCNNRNYIKKSDLVYDPVLAAKINKKQRDMAKKKIQQQQQQQEEQRQHHSPRHRSPRHHHLS